MEKSKINVAGCLFVLFGSGKWINIRWTVLHTLNFVSPWKTCNFSWFCCCNGIDLVIEFSDQLYLLRFCSIIAEFSGTSVMWTTQGRGFCNVFGWVSWNKEIDLFLIFIKEKIIPQKMLNLLCGYGWCGENVEKNYVGKLWKTITWENCGKTVKRIVWEKCGKQ